MKIADSVEIGLCDDPNCSAVHLVLIDEYGVKFAQASLPLEIVKKLQGAFYKKATEKE